MPRNISTRRYAQAIFEIAKEKDSLESWMQDLTLLSETSLNPEFVSLVNSPTVASNQKKDFVDKIFSDSISVLGKNLILLLGSNSNFEMVPEITDLFQKMVDADKGVEKAEIISAVKLTKDDEKKIMAMIKLMVNKDVQLINTVDPKILGGFIATVGDKIIDGSTKSKLSAMRKDLKT
ncbi:MAG: ATP synthase F1 subunit delta [SAR202 cluster bacterium]|nr:ATP synthase F1 subunit delta [SAR202 cluster bacterium]|tara:strand:+ start:1365 stop:1898 length:534 start_codon:yes stop_codon:yes gene_type:complete